MRPLYRRPRSKAERRYRRRLRVRKKVAGTPDRPRLVVFRSLKHVYAQLIDDVAGMTLVGVSDLTKEFSREGTGKVGTGVAVGKLLAERAKAKGITRAVFDRGGYSYHGRVKAIADGARKGGLEF